MSKPSRWSPRFLLRILGPLILVVLIAKVGDPARLWELVARANPLLLLLSIALNLPAIVLKVVRWRTFLRARSFHYDLWPACLAFGASIYTGLVTPGRVGDVLRIRYLKTDAKVPYPEGLATVVADRLCDLYVLAAMVALSIVHFSKTLGPSLLLVGVLVVIGTLLGPLVLLLPGVSERLFGGLYRKLTKGDDLAGLAVFLEATRDLMRRTFIKTLPLTVLSFVLSWGQAWLISESLGLSLAFLDIAALISITSLLGLLPISVSGLGVREAFFVAVGPSLGQTEAESLSLSFMVFVVIYLALAVIGFVAWQVKPPTDEAKPLEGSDTTP